MSLVRWSSMLVLFCLAQTGSAAAEPTEVVVRVIAKDGKFLGTDMGGAMVTLRDADSGEVLAQGTALGATGNTPRIMREAHSRRDMLSDPMAAKFSTVLELVRPRRITAVVTGPLKPSAATTSASATQWVLPGKPINGGDGWVIELPGFAVTALEPLTQLQLGQGPQRVAIATRVVLMCGCPITPGGQWDADKLQIGATLERDGRTVQTVPLSYAGRASEFAGHVQISEPGEYRVTVWAYDPATGNTGLDRFTINAN